MLWLKAFHVIGVVAWFAGLFYLPRLYVYHADAQDLISKQRFVIMERRLFIIMTIGASIAVLFGASMLIESPAYLSARWLQLKLLLVLLVLVYHVHCYVLLRDFADDSARPTPAELPRRVPNSSISGAGTSSRKREGTLASGKSVPYRRRYTARVSTSWSMARVMPT